MSEENFDIDEILRSGRELIDSAYERYNQMTQRDVEAREEEISQTVNRQMEAVELNINRIESFVNIVENETLRSSEQQTPADTSTEFIDLVDIANTSPNRRLIEFIDLCSPTVDAPRTHSPDVVITGMSRLPRRRTNNRRRKRTSTSNNQQDVEEVTLVEEDPVVPKVQRTESISTANDDSSDSGSYKCPICLELTKSRAPTTTKCGHIFCNSCITTVLNLNKNTRKCPMCSKRISARDLVRIYF